MRKKKEKKLSLDDIKKILSEVSDFESFWFCNNTVANSLESLSKLLLEVDDSTFRYHLHKNKNDYEEWIKTIIGDEEFSKEISRVKTRITLSKKIQERVLFLKKELKKLEKDNVKVKSKNRKSDVKKSTVKKANIKKSNVKKNVENKNSSKKLQLKKIVR